MRNLVWIMSPWIPAKALRHRIPTAASQRVTAQNSHDGKVKPLHRAKPLKRLNGIFRTRRNITATSPDPSRKHQPVELNERNKKTRSHGQYCLKRPTASGRRFFTARRQASVPLRTKAFAAATATSRPMFFNGRRILSPISNPTPSSSARDRNCGRS